MSTTCESPNEIRRRKRRFVNPLTLPQQFLPGLKPTPKDITALLMTGSCEHCKKPVMPKNRLCQRCVERQTALASMKPFLRDHPDADVTDEVLEALATCDYDGESGVVDEWIKKKTAEIRGWWKDADYCDTRDPSPTSLASVISGDVDEDDTAGDDDEEEPPAAARKPGKVDEITATHRSSDAFEQSFCAAFASALSSGPDYAR